MREPPCGWNVVGLPSSTSSAAAPPAGLARPRYDRIHLTAPPLLLHPENREPADTEQGGDSLNLRFRAVTFRAAVVGLGDAGYSLHLPALSATPGVEIVAMCDIDAERRARAAKRWKVASFEQFDDMLAKKAPDLVIIGTPPDTHADYCRRSFAAGAHVICEKPFVPSLAEADEVIAAAQTAGRGLALNHEFREMPIFRAVRDAIADRPNEIVFVQVWQLIDMAPWAEGGWRGQMLQRTLFEAGVHLIDFVLALFAERPISVSATTSNGGHAAEGDGAAAGDAVVSVTLEFSRGRLAHVVQSRLSKGDRQYFEARVDTGRESLRASFGGRSRLSAGLFRSTRPHLRFEFGSSGIAWREVGATRKLLARNPSNPGMRATRDVFERSLRAFRDSVQPLTTGQQARNSLEVIIACYRSAATGARVRLDSASLSALAGVRLGSSLRV